MRSVPTAGVAFLVLVLVCPGTFGADASLVHLDWQEGSSPVGLHGVGHEEVNEVRFAFDVGPCHRDLRLDLLYEPASAGKPDGSDPRIPYVFHAAVYGPDGSLFSERSLSDSRYGYPMGIVPEAGTYEVMVRLDVGVLVDWDVRMRGWTAFGDLSCDIYLNEAETNAGTIGHEWIEVFNRADTPFDLGGWTVYGTSWLRDAAVPLFVIPADTSVPAGGHVQIVVDANATFGDENETVVLGDPAGRPLDRSPRITDLDGDTRTWARLGDGTDSWGYGAATPGTTNEA